MTLHFLGGAPVPLPRGRSTCPTGVPSWHLGSGCVSPFLGGGCCGIDAYEQCLYSGLCFFLQDSDHLLHEGKGNSWFPEDLRQGMIKKRPAVLLCVSSIQIFIHLPIISSHFPLQDHFIPDHIRIKHCRA